MFDCGHPPRIAGLGSLEPSSLAGTATAPASRLPQPSPPLLLVAPPPMHHLLALSLIVGTIGLIGTAGLGSAAHAADLTRRKTGVGVHVATTARQDAQGGLALTFRTKEQLLVRATLPMAMAVDRPAWGGGVDVLWRTGPELKEGATQLFLRYGGGLLLGTDQYGIETVAVTQGVAGAEVHLAGVPAAVDFELKPQLVVSPERALDLAVGVGVSWWF